jgi:hypothetical protein
MRLKMYIVCMYVCMYAFPPCCQVCPILPVEMHINVLAYV